MSARHRARAASLVALCTAGALAGATLTTQAQATTSAAVGGLPIRAEAPVFEVVQSGLDQAQVAELAKAAGIDARALSRNGSFSYVDAKTFAKVPSLAGKKGKDEDGRATRVQKVDLKALRALETLPDERALGLARQLLPAPEGFEVEPRVGHTQVQIGGRRGKLTEHLRPRHHGVLRPVAVRQAGLRAGREEPDHVRRCRERGAAGRHPAQRPAGRIRRHHRRRATAQEQCAKLYGPRVKQDTPTLVYYAPALGGSVKQLLPSYACHPSNVAPDAVSDLGGRLVPAAPELTPELSIVVSRSGRSVEGDCLRRARHRAVHDQVGLLDDQPDQGAAPRCPTRSALATRAWPPRH